MITLHDLDEAIAECQGERNPNANTCIKLAAFYTIRQKMFGDDDERKAFVPQNGYSTQQEPSKPQEQAETYINYDSGTEFSGEISGLHSDDVWPIMDELMTVLHATNQRLYSGVLRKIQHI